MGDRDLAPVADNELERQHALEVLVSAFIADPFIRWFYPDDEPYQRHFPDVLVAFGGKAMRAGTTWRLGAFDAVALWYPPDLEPDDAVLEVLRATVRPDIHDDLFAILDQMGAAHPTYRHWYLPWFGVRASKQNRGIGGDLMRRCLEVVDADHLPAYLESPNAKNLPFYERHGFEVTGASRSGTAPPMYSMLRAAR